MMTERTPKTSTIRHGWAQGHPFPLTTDIDERYAEFDRWLAAHDAEVRASVVAEEPEWEVAGTFRRRAAGKWEYWVPANQEETE